MARKLILPLIFLIAIAALLIYIGNTRQFAVEIGGKRVESTLQMAAIFLIATQVIILGVWALILWVRRLPQKLKKGLGKKRADTGLSSLEAALIACEAGDGARAQRRAEKASALLERPNLAAYVKAKAAEAAGDEAAASAQYQELSGNEATALAGLRGLARLAEARSDHSSAAGFAERAFAEAPDRPWAFRALLSAQMHQADWTAALATVAKAEKRKIIDRAEATRRRAALGAAQAAKLYGQGDAGAAREAAIGAAALDPAFAPAAALAAHMLSENGNDKKAIAVIEKAWAKVPHPALALALRDTVADDQPRLDRRLRALIKSNPDHRESQILAAEMAIESEDGPNALIALGELLRSDSPSARLCILAAKAESLLGNQVESRRWQIMASSAPIEDDWSDLDPAGPAFLYDERDWQRLAESYGVSAALIHPRYEQHLPRRAAANFDPAKASSPAKEDEAKTQNPSKPQTEDEPAPAPAPPRPDDPGILEEGKPAKDLAGRLDKLLGG